MFETNQPSLITFKMPSWTGGVQEYGGRAWDKLTYFGRKALDAVAKPLDPVSKGADAVASEATQILKDTAGGIKAAAHGISSGIKWGAFLIVAGLAIYAFAVASPFIPKPQGGR